MSIVTLTKENFDKTVSEHNMVVIDFWAEWCGPCKAFAPIFESTAKQHDDVVFAKVNTEEQPELAQDFNIRSIPTIMILRENIAVFSQSGSLPATAFNDLITQAKNLNMDDVRKNIETTTGE